MSVEQSMTGVVLFLFPAAMAVTVSHFRPDIDRVGNNSKDREEALRYQDGFSVYCRFWRSELLSTRGSRKPAVPLHRIVRAKH